MFDKEQEENTMVVNTMDPPEWLRKHLEQDDPDVLREMIKGFSEILMSAEVDAICNAGEVREPPSG